MLTVSCLTKACHNGKVRSEDSQDVIHGCAPDQYAVEYEVAQAKLDGVGQAEHIILILLRVPRRRNGRCRKRYWQSMMACPAA